MTKPISRYQYLQAIMQVIIEHNHKFITFVRNQNHEFAKFVRGMFKG